MVIALDKGTRFFLTPLNSLSMYRSKIITSKNEKQGISGTRHYQTKSICDINRQVSTIVICYQIIQRRSNQKYREQITEKQKHGKPIKNLYQLVKDVSSNT